MEPMAFSPPFDDGPFAALLGQIDDLLIGDAVVTPTDDPPRPFADTDLALVVGQAFERGFSGDLVITTAASPPAAHVIHFEAGRPIDVAPAFASLGERAIAHAADVERWFFQAVASGGTYQLRAPRPPRGRRVHSLRHPAALVAELLLRRPGLSPIAAKLTQGHNRLRLRQLPWLDDLVAAAAEDPTVRSAVRLFDGYRRLDEVVGGQTKHREALLRGAFVLYCFGALAIEADGEAATAPASADTPAVQLQDLRALAALASQGDLFAFLGVDREASQREVMAAVARLDRALSTDELVVDVALSSGRDRALIESVLSEARRVLGDDDLRAAYRAHLPARVEPKRVE